MANLSRRSDISIVGGDFNSERDPDYINEKAKSLASYRFRILEGEGFRWVQHSANTARNPDRGEACLDHFFIRSSQLSEGDVVFERNPLPVGNIEENSSDHAPICMTIKVNKSQVATNLIKTGASRGSPQRASRNSASNAQQKFFLLRFLDYIWGEIKRFLGL